MIIVKIVLFLSLVGFAVTSLFLDAIGDKDQSSIFSLTATAIGIVLLGIVLFF